MENYIMNYYSTSCYTVNWKYHNLSPFPFLTWLLNTTNFQPLHLAPLLSYSNFKLPTLALHICICPIHFPISCSIIYTVLTPAPTNKQGLFFFFSIANPIAMWTFIWHFGHICYPKNKLLSCFHDPPLSQSLCLHPLQALSLNTNSLCVDTSDICLDSSSFLLKRINLLSYHQYPNEFQNKL